MIQSAVAQLLVSCDFHGDNSGKETELLSVSLITAF